MEGPLGPILDLMLTSVLSSLPMQVINLCLSTSSNGGITTSQSIYKSSGPLSAVVYRSGEGTVMATEGRRRTGARDAPRSLGRWEGTEEQG